MFTECLPHARQEAEGSSVRLHSISAFPKAPLSITWGICCTLPTSGATQQLALGGAKEACTLLKISEAGQGAGFTQKEKQK